MKVNYFYKFRSPNTHTVKLTAYFYICIVTVEYFFPSRLFHHGHFEESPPIQPLDLQMIDLLKKTSYI